MTTLAELLPKYDGMSLEEIAALRGTTPAKLRARLLDTFGSVVSVDRQGRLQVNQTEYETLIVPDLPVRRTRPHRGETASTTRSQLPVVPSLLLSDREQETNNAGRINPASAKATQQFNIISLSQKFSNSNKRWARSQISHGTLKGQGI